MNNKLTRAVDIVERALKNEHSDFYRTFYGTLQAPEPTKVSWHKVPILHKEDIMPVPYERRVFLPKEGVYSIRATSGTSGRGMLCLPHAAVGEIPRYLSRDFSVMMSFNYYFYISKDKLGLAPTQQIVSGDPRHMKESTELAASLHIDGLYGLSSTFISFAEHLRQVYDLGAIRTLWCTGERMSVLQRRILENLFPNARIWVRYNSSEVQSDIADTPETPLREHPEALSVLDRYYLELVDETGSHVPEGVEGEIVLTSLDPTRAFPLIRYAMGDNARMFERGGTTYIELLGRTGKDRVRLPGGEITLAALEQAVHALGYIADFEAVVVEELHDGRPLPRLVVTYFSDVPLPFSVSSDLARALPVNTGRTYADNVARGEYAPITCDVHPLSTKREGKRSGLIDKR